MLEGVNLKWNDFEENLIKCFKNFRTILNDVTIFCGSEKITANKFVLCASSEIFREILVESDFSNQQNSSVLLWDVEVSLMSLILDFMYYGEVQVTEGNLNDFLFLAKRLRVKGLVADEPKVKSELTSVDDVIQSQNNIENTSRKSAIKKKSVVDIENSIRSSKSSRLDNTVGNFNDSSSKEVIDLENVLQNSNSSMVLKSGEDFFTKRPGAGGGGGGGQCHSLPGGGGQALSEHHQDALSFLHHSSVPDLEPLEASTNMLVDTLALDTFNNTIMDPSYKCNLCLKTYKTKGSLYNHMSLYHRGQKGE